MDHNKARALIDAAWDESIVPALMDYIRIPNKSPSFDADWDAHGHMEAAVQLMRRWAEANAPRGRARRGPAGFRDARRCCSSTCPGRSTTAS